MSSINNMPPEFLQQFDSQADRVDLAKKYMERWASILEDQQPWAEMCNKSSHVFDRKDMVVINMWKSVCNYKMAASWPSSPKPAVEHLPTHDDQQDKVYRAVADMYRGTLQKEMDNSAFDYALKEAIRNSVKFGRGMIGIEIRPPSNKYPTPCLKFKSYPWNRIFVEQADNWDEVSCIMTLERVLKAQLGKYTDGEFNTATPAAVDSLSYTDNAGFYIPNEETEKYSHLLKVYDKEDYSITYIWMENGRVIARYDDPYNLPNFFPFALPIQPSSDPDKFFPRCPFEDISDAQARLDNVQMRKEKLIPTIAVKMAAGVNDPALNDLITSTENSVHFLKDSKVLSQFAQGGGLEALLWQFPLDTITQALINLNDEETRIIEHINDITGINDLLRGQTDGKEAAQTQALKSMYGNVRMRPLQQNIHWTVRDAIQIMFDLARTYPLSVIESKSQRPLNIGPRDEEGNPTMGPPPEQQFEDPNMQEEADKTMEDFAISQAIMSPDLDMRIDIDSETMRNVNVEENLAKVASIDQMIAQFIEMSQNLPDDDPKLSLTMLKIERAKFDLIAVERGVRIQLEEALDLQISQLEDEVEMLKDPNYQKQKEDERFSKTAKFDPEMRKALAQEAKDQADAQQATQAAQTAAMQAQNETQKIANQAFKDQEDIKVANRQIDANLQIAASNNQQSFNELLQKQKKDADDDDNAKEQLRLNDRELDIKEKAQEDDREVELAKIAQGKPADVDTYED